MTLPHYRRKTVLMIAYTYYESDPRVMREAEAAMDGGFEVDFLALRRSDTAAEEIIRGVRVIRLDQSKYRGGGHLRYLVEYIKFFLRCFVKTTMLFFKRRYTVIHVNNMPDCLVFCTIVPRLFGAKIILDIHDPMPDTFVSKFKGRQSGFFYRALLWQERLSAAYCHRVVTVHHLIKDAILVKHGLNPDLIEVVANFADDELFSFRKGYSIEGQIRLVFHGTILERAGLRRLMTGLSLLRHPDRISVTIIGEGDFSDELKTLIQTFNLEKVVNFDNRSYPARSIPERIENYNVGLVPLEISSITNYALPLKLVEYISLGLPVVSIRNDAISYYFDEKDCIFFQWDDPGSLSSTLDNLAENPELLLHYRERSVALRERFSWTGEKRKYIALLRHLAGVVRPASEPGDVNDSLHNSIQKVVRWVEKHNYKAYDPGDGDLSFLRHFTFNTFFLRRALTAAVLRTPFHIRPWIGIRPHTSTKGMGYMGWGYVKMYASNRTLEYRRQAEFCFDWLIEHRSPGEPQYCWGNHFSFSTRAGTIPRHRPTIVWSSLIGLAFLEAYEVLGNPNYLDVAASTAEWVKRLPREQTPRGTCLSYVAFKQVSIHNSNMLGAGLLARIGVYTNDREAVELAKDAMTYSCSRQKSDGAWFYGEEPRYRWIDSFHTAYNLDSLKRYIDTTGDSDFEQNLKRGVQYFKLNFFGENGNPKHYHDKVGPSDIQCAAQSIDSLAFLSDSDPDFLELAAKVAQWTIDNMQAPDGHFYYRDLGWKKVKTPMFHWGQATTFKALAHLQNKLNYQATGSSRQELGIFASETVGLVD